VTIEITKADLGSKEHAEAVLDLLDAYSRDAMGAGKPLDPRVKRTLISGLQKHPTTIVFLAYSTDQDAGPNDAKPVGIAVCFGGFSTFAAQPLINIHDLAVLPEHRGAGVGRSLLESVVAEARATGCCKVTLEVLERNHRARRVYAAAGFGQGETESGGGTLFLANRL
jgi:GNAT superfamily N-acetyltransferase